MATLRIQNGHVARRSGNTGTSNSRLGVTEQEMNIRLSQAIVAQGRKLVPSLTVEVYGADDTPGGKPDIGLALHMDGAINSSASGGSFGHNNTSNSKRFVAILKRRYLELDPPSDLRGDNYTSALRNYYGYKSSYMGWGSGPKVVLENGFLTNDIDGQWAIDNVDRVAEAIVLAAAEYLSLGVNLPSAVTKPAAEIDPQEWYKIVGTATGRVVSEAVILFQERLRAWGYAVDVDGLMGPQTKSAMRLWQLEHLSGVTTLADASGIPGPGQWAKLMSDPPKAESEPEPEPAPTMVVESIPLAEGQIAMLKQALTKIKEIADEQL